jgi:hypothetical protein
VQGSPLIITTIDFLMKSAVSKGCTKNKSKFLS